MDDLNQFVISRVLGSTMKHAKRPGFGPLGLLHAQHQALAQVPKEGEQIAFAPSVDKLILRAFEETRKGFAVDRAMADPSLASKFVRRAAELGVSAPDHAVILRLFRFRKSPRARFRITHATSFERKRDYSKFSFAAEMAISQMKYRYGASVDDILAYPNIGADFHSLCEGIRPGFTALEYRLAALHVRKSRYCKQEQLSLFDSMDEDRAESMKTRHQSLDKIDPRDFRNVNAIVGLVEESRGSRFLYITRSSDVSQTVRPFTKERTFEALGHTFWKPTLSTIHLHLYDIKGRFENANQSLWTKKLIQVKSPIFNAPIHLKA